MSLLRTCCLSLNKKQPYLLNYLLMKLYYKNCILIILIFLSQLSFAKKNFEPCFPEKYLPETIGDWIGERFIQLNKHELYREKYINYQEVCLWVGALKYARLTDNKELLKQLTDRFEVFFSTEKYLVPPPIHVDLTVFGAIPLRIYNITKDQRYFDMGISYADTQWKLPEKATPEEKAWMDQGFSWQTRLWIDDMYMITLLQSEAYKATGDRKYIDRAAKQMVKYLDELQRPNGLFYHAPDAPFFWGRGNGWMAAGMTELLNVLPAENPDRPRILEGYRTMMSSLVKYQSPSGMWNQLIDDPDSWVETSCSGMFTFAMITGVKSGWINGKDYEKSAKNAWLALVDYINEDKDIIDVCVGTNKGFTREYYYDRKRRTGDYHGQATLLWCAYALLNNSSENNNEK